MHENHTALVSALEQEIRRVRQELPKTAAHEEDWYDGSHDINHCRRVLQNALQIAEEHRAVDLTVLIASVYLHDLVNLRKDDRRRRLASRMSARAAQPILQRLRFSPASIAAVQHCIEAHSFSAGIIPETLEARVLQDADRLESLGTLGIARTFYTAGTMEGELFHPTDPFAHHRPLDDKRYAVDHFRVKLLKLPDTMKTEAGRKMALHRTASMLAFLAALATELGTDLPWSVHGIE